MHRTLSFRLGSFSLALALLFTSLLRVPLAGASPASQPNPAAAQFSPDWQGELRGFWVDVWRDGVKSPEQIQKLIDDAHAANANALFVQVRAQGESYYNNSIEPRAASDSLAPLPFDPLASVIEAAHNANPPLQVHAWVVTFHVGDATHPTDPGRHVYFQHGDGRSWDDADNWMTYGYDGRNLAPSPFLDPGNPGAVQYTVEVMKQLVRDYDVDGLHLDYVRYPEDVNGTYYGYNKVSVDRFNAAYGREGLPDPFDGDWMAWRREQVTDVVRRIYLETTAIKPQLIVSVATVTWDDGPYQRGWENSAAYSRVFQDWRAWLEEGIIDLAMPMNYNQESNSNSRWWYWNWLEWEKDHQYGRGVVVGPANYLNSIGQSLSQIAEALSPSTAGNMAAGVCLYSYASTNSTGARNSTFYNALAQGNGYGDPPFSSWVNPPVLPWKANPATGSVMGTAVGDDDQPLPRAEVILTGPVTRTLHADSNGFFGAVDLPAGSYTAQAAGADAASVQLRGDVGNGNVTDLRPVTALSQVAIQGPTTVLRGEATTFSVVTAVESLNAPLQYQWNNGSTDNNATYRWLQVGQQTITATVSAPHGEAQVVAQVQVVPDWTNEVCDWGNKQDCAR